MRPGETCQGFPAGEPSVPAGIQAEKPPWEQPGCFRRDCEPHHGRLLYWSAAASLFLATCAFALPLPAALPLSAVTWAWARRDLALMQKGLLDRNGEVLTQEALSRSRCAFWICCQQALWLCLSLAATAIGLLLIRWIGKK